MPQITFNGDNKKDLYEDGLRFVYRLNKDYAILAPKAVESGKLHRTYMLFRKTQDEQADAFLRKVPYGFERPITKSQTPELYLLAFQADEERG